MRNADLDDLKDDQYAEQVKQERKEVDAMPKTQTTQLTADIKILADGSIDGNAYQFICWKPGDTSACLDGDFDAADLLAIGKHMEKYNVK